MSPAHDNRRIGFRSAIQFLMAGAILIGLLSLPMFAEIPYLADQFRNAGAGLCFFPIAMLAVVNPSFGAAIAGPLYNEEPTLQWPWVFVIIALSFLLLWIGPDVMTAAGALADGIDQPKMSGLAYMLFAFIIAIFISRKVTNFILPWPQARTHS